MKIAYIPKGDYKIGQRITMGSRTLIIEGYTYTGRNVTAVTMPDADKFERVVCICTDAEPIGEKTCY